MRQLLRSLVLRAVVPATGRRRPEGGPTKVLAIRPDHLGDLLLTTPALQVLRSRLPEAHIALLVGPWNEDAARHLPWVDEVLTCPFPWFDRAPKPHPWEPYQLLHTFAQRLTGAGFTEALVLRHDFWFGAALAAGAGIPRRVGYALPALAPYLTQPVPFPGESHEALQAAALVEAAFPGGAGEAAAPVSGFVPTEAERSAAAELLGARAGSGRLVAVHPGSGAAVKAWPLGHFAGVIRWLAGDRGAEVVVTGGPGERGLVESLVAASGGAARPVVGQPVGVTAAVLERCHIAWGPDSGIMHLAAAVGTPTVRLYGPAGIERFGPWGDPAHHRVVRSDPPCLPCGRLDYRPEELPLHPCVRSIAPATVMSAIDRLLATVPRRA